MTTIVNGTAASEGLLGNSNPADIHDLMNANWSAGDDIMLGGTGNDTYNVNSVGDWVVENASQGIDKVVSRINSYTLGNNLENLTLDNALVWNGFFFVRAAVNGTGNSLANTIIGNDNANTLSGMGGNDWLQGGNGNDTVNGDDGDDFVYGEAGADTVNGGNGNDYVNGGSENDTMNGGAGNDTMVGGTGNDAMTGGSGNDTYYVDSFFDTTVEAAFGGIDQVYSTVSRTLSAEVENLTLQGTALSGTGNASSNVITGNASNNTLRGMTGNDTLNGGLGNDRLIGDAGLDTMTGGVGLDTFVFNTSGATNRDIVTDFNHFDDTVELANALDAAMVGAISPGLKGLAFIGGNVAGNTLSGGWYFENIAFNLSGIYYYDGSGEVWYNPTNGAAGDEVLLGRLGLNQSAIYNNTDFVLGA